jgi:hypothetical protein
LVPQALGLPAVWQLPVLSQQPVGQEPDAPGVQVHVPSTHS